jgi:formamidopyrimidine-DNA glycosylase
MPELPEVEVVRRGLAGVIRGRRITRVSATNERVVRHHRSPRQFSGAVRDRTVTAVDRLGKNLLVRLDDDATLVVHLGMSGQLRIAPPRAARARHTHVVFRFDDGGDEVHYVDPRTFGELFVVPPGVAPLAHLGPDALDGLPAAAFAALLGARRVKVKPLLMDQRAIAGIGNIYSDEALFAAGLRWDRSSASLSADECTRLHTAITTILTDAVEHRGSSLADAQYVDLMGQPGEFQLRHQVYARAGLPCARCGRPIVRERWGGRSTFFCEVCQS